MGTLSAPGVVSIQEIFDGTGGGIDEYGNRTYVRKWQVIVDDLKVGPLEATSIGLPALHSFYEYPNTGGAPIEKDFGATLRSYDVERHDEGFRIIVTARYSSAPTQTRFDYNPADYGSQGGPLETGNPLEQTPIGRASQVQWGTVRVQKSLRHDLDTKAFTASNGQKLDPPVLVDRTYLTLSISRNEASYNPQNAMNFIDTVNSTLWNLPIITGNFAVQPGLAKCESITAVSMVEQRFFFWRVSYVFHLNPNKNDSNQFEGWQPQTVDNGTYELRNSPLTGWVRQPITDPFTSLPVTTAVPLDGKGLKLNPTGVNGQGVPQFTYSYLTFRCYRAVDFNLLGLP